MVAIDLLAALVITSLLRAHIGYRVWRAVHWSAYACWPVAMLHGLSSGTDAATSWARAVYIACAALVLAGVGWRVSASILSPSSASTRRVTTSRSHTMTAVAEPSAARAADEPRLLPRPSAARLVDHLARLGPAPRLAPARLLIGEVERAGLRGRGGAGFPTATKMEAVRARGARVIQGRTPIVVANGTEGEPLSAKDKTLLVHAPHLVLDGMVAAAHAVGADEAVVCVERSADPGAARARAGDRRASTRARRHHAAGRDARRRATSPARRPRSSTGSTAARPNPPSRRPDRSSAASIVDPRSSTTSRRSRTSRSSRASVRRGGAASGTEDDPGTMLVTLERRHPSRASTRFRSAHPLRRVLRNAGAHDVIGVLVGGYFGTWLTPRQAGDGDAVRRRPEGDGRAVWAAVRSRP